MTIVNKIIDKPIFGMPIKFRNSKMPFMIKPRSLTMYLNIGVEFCVNSIKSIRLLLINQNR
jgi:hypothetical protein